MEVKLKYINHLFIVLENNNLQCGAAISSSNMERTCICIRQLIIDEGIAGQSRVGVEKSTHKQRQSHILHQEAFILLFSLEAIGPKMSHMANNLKSLLIDLLMAAICMKTLFESYSSYM